MTTNPALYAPYAAVEWLRQFATPPLAEQEIPARGEN